MKIHNQNDQFDGKPHPVCGRGDSAVSTIQFEATEPTLRCKLCERDWFPSGQPEWHRKQAIQRQIQHHEINKGN
jgi:hypothetical protein